MASIPDEQKRLTVSRLLCWASPHRGSTSGDIAPVRHTGDAAQNDLAYERGIEPGALFEGVIQGRATTRGD